MNPIAALERKLGKYKQAGDEYSFECPKCSSGKGKRHLGINLKKGLFNCFKCHYKGHISSLVGDVEFRTNGVDRPVVLKQSILPEGFYPLAAHDPDHFEAIRKLEKRGITFKRIVEMGIGMTNLKGLSGRVIIPIREYGECVYWVARAYDGRLPKEKSPRNADMNVKRSEVLYGLDEIPMGAPVTLVEGIFDAERIRRYGGYAIALLGCKLSDVQCGKILAKDPVCVSILMDGDAAGRMAAPEIWRVLRNRRPRLHIEILDIMGDKDPDDLSDSELDKFFNSVL